MNVFMYDEISLLLGMSGLLVSPMTFGEEIPQEFLKVLVFGCVFMDFSFFCR